jgi:drug/metabolite transporter (DMT)-like permease
LVIGGLVAFAGTLIIGFATSTGEADLAGVLLVLLSATVYSIAMVAQKVVLHRIPALQVTWLACLIGSVACLPFAGALVSGLSHRGCRSWESSTSNLCRLRSPSRTWAYALSQTSAGKLGVTTFLVPPITIFLGRLFLSEVPPILAIVGGALSLVGVAIARRRI